jgi:hypothetical protein
MNDKDNRKLSPIELALLRQRSVAAVLQGEKQCVARLFGVKRGDKLKMLYFDRNGLAIWYNSWSKDAFIGRRWMRRAPNWTPPRWRFCWKAWIGKP